MDISFLIPTLEKLEPGSNLQKVVDSINSQPTKYSYEICIYSPYPTEGENVRWVEEKNMLGPLYGFTYMFQHGSDGEYIIIAVDDHQFVTPFDYAIDKLKSQQFENRKFKLCSLSTNDGQVQPLPFEGARFGSVLKMKNGGWPKGITMRFPVCHRDTVNTLLHGYIFHPEFRYHAGDIWLGCYLSFMGEPGLECLESRIQSIPGGMKNFEWEVADANTAYALVKNWQSDDRDYVAPERPMQSPGRYHLIRDSRPYVGII